MEITWNIGQLDRNIEDGFVNAAHWICAAEDGEISVSTYGICGFEGDLITPYENLTEERVLNWVWESVDKAKIESSLTSQIEAKKNPVTASGVPWQ